MKSTIIVLISVFIIISSCQQNPSQNSEAESAEKETYELLGYDSEVAWGEHIVTISGCTDCHSPKVMTDHGPEPDPNNLFAGHLASEPVANLDRKAIEQNGYAACSPSFTSWVGPWGISYAANLTPHATGLGNWTLEHFSRAIREGKFKGLENERDLLPPMPWFQYKYMTDDEVSAVFAYFQSITPIENVVPSPQPPLAAAMKK